MRYITIEGNIGAGKSTLAKLLSAAYKAPLILEEFADNSFLPLFYNSPERYALPLELSFLADRYKQLKYQLDLYRTEPIIVADYVFPKSSLFAGINLQGAEYDLFASYFDIISPNIPQPDLLVFLDAPIDALLKNIKERGREYEQNIQPKYLEQVQEIYRQYISASSLKTIIIDRTAVDFLKYPEYLPELLQFINNCKENEIYRFAP